MLTRRTFLSGSAVIAAGCLHGSDSSGSGTRENTLEDYASNITRNSPRRSTLSVDDTVFVEPDRIDLKDEDVVFGLEHEGEVLAYPRRMLVFHRVVNDTVGSESVLITYSPLTGTAVGFKRGGVEFGRSGLLINSNLVMYDARTESLWPQILGTAIDGQRAGETLELVPLVWTTWGRWLNEHPETSVLSEGIGRSRDYDYDTDPYGSYSPRTGYYENEEINYSLMHTSDRFPPKKVFICASDTENAVAFDKDELHDEEELAVETDEGEYVATYDEALDTASIERDGETLVAFDAMWFAWASFYPETEVRG